MRVTVYFNSSYPYGVASTNRVHQLCKGLQNNEVDVELLITNPTESDPDTLNEQVRGTFEGVKFKYLSKTTLRPQGLFQRKAKDILCYFRTYNHLIFSAKDSDAVIVIGGATFDFRILIPLLARLINKNIYLEINEYPFVTRKDGLRKSFMQFFFFRLVVPCYNGFIVISEALGKEISNFKSKTARIIKIPILSEIVKANEPDSFPPYTVPYIFHAGSLIEQKDGIIGSLKAFAKAIKEYGVNSLYLFAGNPDASPDIDKINKIIHNENLEGSVIFTGYLDKNRLAYYYRHASFAIINKSRNKQNEYGFATKISEYIAFGIPIIVTQVGEMSNYFKNGFNALIVEPDNIDQIAQAIAKLTNDRKSAETLASNAFSLLETEFNSSLNGARLRDFLTNRS